MGQHLTAGAAVVLERSLDARRHVTSMPRLLHRPLLLVPVMDHIRFDTISRLLSAQ
jgi:hypothetical protein